MGGSKLTSYVNRTCNTISYEGNIQINIKITSSIDELINQYWVDFFKKLTLNALHTCNKYLIVNKQPINYSI